MNDKTNMRKTSFFERFKQVGYIQLHLLFFVLALLFVPQIPGAPSGISSSPSSDKSSSGNDLVIIITGSGEREAEPYDGESGAAPLLVVDYTAGGGAGSCSGSGNADVVTSQSGVTNSSFALGAPNSSSAELYETNDEIVLDLTDEIPTGTDYTIRWRRDPGSGSNPSMSVEESANGSSWTTATGSPFRFSNTSYFYQTITASTGTRYVRIRSLNTYNTDLDAISYACGLAPEICANGIDDDGDCLIDGNDPDCPGSCPGGQTCWTTVKAGNWSDPTVWDLGTVPADDATTGEGDGNIPANDVVNVKHNVNYDLSANIDIYGELHILGDTLNVPSGRSLTINNNGLFSIINGAYITPLFNGGSPNSGGILNQGGREIHKGAYI